MVVQISSGQGPEECQIAVGKLFDAWKKEFLNKVRSKGGQNVNKVETGVRVIL